MGDAAGFEFRERGDDVFVMHHGRRRRLSEGTRPCAFSRMSNEAIRSR
jgi:hypothetical protein